MRVTALVLLLAAAVLAAPTSKEDDDKLVVTKEFFPDAYAVYTGEHEIVNLLVPLNSLNFDEDSDDDDDESDDVIAFFAEADINNGVKDYKGVYALKNNTATKILETGTDAAAANDDTKTVYFSATDGIYTYNAKDNTAEKYGSFTGNYKAIAKVNGTDEIYVVTDSNEVYKVSDNGNKKEKLADVEAESIVLDYSNNLYYYGADKKPYVITEDGKKSIEGLPAEKNYVALLKPTFVLENGVPFIVDDKAYVIYANGTSELTTFVLSVKPSAYAMEATLIQYYGYNKKIYKYNLLELIFGELLQEVKSYLDDKTEQIQDIATRSRGNLVP